MVSGVWGTLSCLFLFLFHTVTTQHLQPSADRKERFKAEAQTCDDSGSFQSVSTELTQSSAAAAGSSPPGTKTNL